MKTFTLKQKDIKNDWILIDATGIPVGRLASRVTLVLRGKHKAVYTPFQSCGDNVVIINADKAIMTGKKMQQKVYYRHTQYPGGLKVAKASNMSMKEIIKKAVKRMMPTTVLSHQQMSMLKVFENESHPYNNVGIKKYEIKDL